VFLRNKFLYFFVNNWKGFSKKSSRKKANNRPDSFKKMSSLVAKKSLINIRDFFVVNETNLFLTFAVLCKTKA